MNEQDAGTLTTLTLTVSERVTVADGLMLRATMLDAMGDYRGAKAALCLWERVSPDYSE